MKPQTLLRDLSHVLPMTQNALWLVNTGQTGTVCSHMRLSLKILGHNSINSFVYEPGGYKTPAAEGRLTDRETAERKSATSLFCCSSFAQHFQEAPPAEAANSSTGETQQEVVGGSSQVNQEIVRNGKLDMQVEQDGNFWAILFLKAFKNLFMGCNF